MIEDYIQKILINYFIFFSLVVSPFLKIKSNKDWGDIYEERCSGNIKR
jgi:hypothetical protein